MRKFVVRVLLPLVAMLLATSVSARTAVLNVQRLDHEFVVADALQLRVQWPSSAGEGGEQGKATLSLQAKRLELRDRGIAFRDLRWECVPTRTADAQFACDGELRAKDIAVSRLKATWANDMLDLRFSQGKIGIDLAGPTQDAAWTLTTRRLPATWLNRLLADLWPDGHVTDGSIDTRWRIASSEDALSLAGPLTLRGLGLDSKDGRIAAASLDVDGDLDVQTRGNTQQVKLAWTLTGGEILLGPLYASLPEAPITVAATLQSNQPGTWNIEDAAWRDSGTLELQADAVVEIANAAPLQTLNARFSSADLATATPRYFDSLLGSIGLAGLATSGGSSGKVQMRAGALTGLDARFTQASIHDAAQRFGIDGLDGALRLHAGADPVASALRWRAAQVHQIAFGAADFALRSRAMGIELTAPARLPTLGGAVELPRFAWQPSAASDAAGLDMAVGVRGVDLRQLSRAFGWPEFAGTLSGDIPSVRYAGEVLDLQGGLAMQVFDGRVRIDDLTLERPFGVAPTMTAAIEFSDLDLKPLTGAFGFGEITGRLGGHVRDLRLVDWEPVAFDAAVATSTTARDPRRISQRAVRDLTEVGGGGIAAGLQAQMLKVFQTFGYARIGLSCTLANDVCRMGGLDREGDGYTIVEGAGLPRVTVIGHQRQVDWPVLVARLKAATEGQVPIVE